MRHLKTVVLVTATLLLIVAGVILFYPKTELPDAVDLNYKGHPTIGYPGAQVHLIMFEEPKCINCAAFNQEVFPQIKKNYIDTHKITYTVIPLSFLPGSMPAAIALLCVYNSNPLYPDDELFFSYLDYIFAHQPSESSDWATDINLIHFAEKTSPAIDLVQLKKCIDMQTYRVKIQQNTDYAKKVMKGELGTPTLYVNGIRVEKLSYNEICHLIDRVLESQGVATP